MIESGSKLSRPLHKNTQLSKEGFTVPFDNKLRESLRQWNKTVSQEGWYVAVTEREHPAIEAGLRNFSNGGDLIIGMSLENSYFSRDTVARLIRYLGTLEVDVFIAVMDQPSKHNYRALGYSEKIIDQKIRKKGANLRLKIKSALKGLDKFSEHFQIMDWSYVYEQEEYLHAKSLLEEIQMENKTFREDLASCAETYLRPKSKQDLSEGSLREAEKYLLEELAFLVASSKIFNRESLSYLYHRPWPIFEKLTTGEYGDIQAPGFIELAVRNSEQD